MSKSAIYLVNNVETAVATGTVIPLGTVIRRYGQNVKQDGNSVAICDRPGCAGYYKVDAIATLRLKEVGKYRVTLEKDGVAVIGAVAEVDPATIGQVVPLPISVIVRNSCGGTANLSLKVEGNADVINVTTVVEKL